MYVVKVCVHTWPSRSNRNSRAARNGNPKFPRGRKQPLLYTSFNYFTTSSSRFMTGHGLSSSFVETIAGFTAGIATTLSLHPLDLVKTRLQGTATPYPPSIIIRSWMLTPVSSSGSNLFLSSWEFIAHRSSSLQNGRRLGCFLPGSGSESHWQLHKLGLVFPMLQ
jgi:hypothetical protein